MSYIPSSESRSLVQKIIDDIKRRSEEHAKRHARAKLRVPDSKAVAHVNAATARSRTAQAPWRARSPQHISRHTSLQRDYFTRLVDSSQKPRILRSVHHPVVAHLLKLTHSASYRKYRNSVLLTSTKLIREYCERHGSCSRIYTTSHENPLLLKPPIRADKVLLCSKKLLQKVSQLRDYSGGLLAEVEYPHAASHLGNAALVVCVAPGGRLEDNIKTASLMRTAQALQWQAIWLLKHGVFDFLDPQSIRASQNCLETMPYLSGEAKKALLLASENKLLVCTCSDSGDPFESDRIQQALQQHRGVMLLVGRQPKELIDAAIKINITTASKRWLKTAYTECSTEVQQHYKLDNFSKSCILMYLVRKRLHYGVSRSPFIT